MLAKTLLFCKSRLKKPIVEATQASCSVSVTLLASSILKSIVSRSTTVIGILLLSTTVKVKAIVRSKVR